jgi:phytoene dehydrogenase-like protein
MARQFDAIVIGSGLGGLTAAALYARAGHKVLVLERNHNFGGAATVYRHGPLAIEASLHEIDGLDAGDPKMPVLRSLALDRDIPFVDVGALHEVRSPLLGDPFVLPRGFEPALDALKARFPSRIKGLEGYFDRIRAVRRAITLMSEHQDDRGWWLRHAPALPWQLWPLLRDRHARLSEVLQHLFADDEAVKFALASNLAYYTDDPDTMPFAAFAIPQASYLSGGGHYIRGGSQVLTDRLVAIVRETGGEVEAEREARGILLGAGRVCGVRHRGHDGGDLREDFAPVVFGNAAPSVLAEMLPQETKPAFLLPYESRRPSISLWTMSLGLSRPTGDFGVRHYSVAVLPAWMQSLAELRSCGSFMAQDPEDRLPSYALVAYDQIDSGLNQNGPYLASLVGIDRLANWTGLDAQAKRSRKERWMDRIIGDVDREFPGIAGAVVQREMSTAETFHRYLNTPDGALYGFAPQTRGFTPLASTAVDGLYLASAFTLGGGYTGAILGGSFAARAAMKAGAAREFVYADQ